MKKFLPKKLCLALVLGAFTLYCHAQKKPNIILIMADDLGYETLGCNGNDDKLTPRLDALAKTGMRFENCFSTPLCTPSRVQLMTGKYNNRNYIGFGLLDPKEITFGTLMQQQGYRTCIAGKWQLLGNAGQRKLAGGKIGTLPQNAGFNNYCLWQVDTLGSRYANATVYMPPGTSKKIEGSYGPDIFSNYIEKFMEQNKQAPFFVYYPMVLTHDPFEPTPFSPKGDLPADKNNSYFKDMVRYMDYTVGRLLDKVDQLGIRDNTVIIFMGDNGTSKAITSNFKGDKRKGDKGSTTEYGTHVPLIVNWKGITKAGTVNSNLIDFTDFLPTLLEISGTKISDSLALDGKSFYSQLKGSHGPKRDWVFCHYDPRWGNFKKSTYVHDKAWKVYQSGEIYDLLKDPAETHPLKKSDLTNNQKTKTILFEKVISKMMK